MVDTCFYIGKIINIKRKTYEKEQKIDMLNLWIKRYTN